MRLGGGRDGGFRRGRVGDIAGHCNALDLSRDAFGKLAVDIADRNLGAVRGKPARGRSAQTRCTSGDDGGLTFQLHGIPLSDWCSISAKRYHLSWRCRRIKRLDQRGARVQHGALVD